MNRLSFQVGSGVGDGVGDKEDEGGPPPPDLPFCPLLRFLFSLARGQKVHLPPRDRPSGFPACGCAVGGAWGGAAEGRPDHLLLPSLAGQSPVAQLDQVHEAQPCVQGTSRTGRGHEKPHWPWQWWALAGPLPDAMQILTHPVSTLRVGKWRLLEARRRAAGNLWPCRCGKAPFVLKQLPAASLDIQEAGTSQGLGKVNNDPSSPLGIHPHPGHLGTPSQGTVPPLAT